jgi:hypothetical protein
MSIFVCEKCHELDRAVTGCTRTFEAHDLLKGSQMAKCNICNNIAWIVECNAYKITKLGINKEIIPIDGLSIIDIVGE